MAKTEKIFVGKKLVGIKIKSMQKGSHPVTDDGGALQVLTLKHDKGAHVAPHYHQGTKRVTQTLQECLVVLKGKICIAIYGAKKTPVRSITVRAGEAYIVLAGAIGVRYLEDSEVLETKNGPFKNDTVKLYLASERKQH